MNTNKITKILIEKLTRTHQNPQEPYKQTIQQAQTEEEAEHIKAIYKKITNKSL